jgi:MOB kinase activator 1
MTWVGGLLSDEATFPTKACELAGRCRILLSASLLIVNGSFHFFALVLSSAREFPITFLATAKHIYKQLLRVFAHIYHAQFPHLVHLCCEGHFNSLFAHFIAFGSEFDLFQFAEFKGVDGNSSGQGYPGACDLIEKWVELGTLGPEVLKQSSSSSISSR